MKHHLAVRSDFSLGESLLQIDKLVPKAKDLGYESLALVDNYSLHGMVDFTNRCTKAGIKPIVGVTLFIYDDATLRKEKGKKWIEPPNFRLKCFVQNEKGLTWLMKTLTLANSPERFYYNPRLQWGDLKDAEGCLFSTGDFFNLFSLDDPLTRLAQLNNLVGKENVYVEICPVNSPLWDRTNNIAIECARNLSQPMIVSHPSLYLEPSHADTLPILSLVIENGRTDEGWRPKQAVKDFDLQPPTNIIPKIKDAATRLLKFDGIRDVHAWGDAVKGTAELVSRIDFKFAKMPVNLPDMAGPAGDEFTALKSECGMGWKRRFSAPVLGHKPDLSDPDTFNLYMNRLKFELRTLEKMGFSGYFLLAREIVQFSKKNGIIVGPGRGSVGGSLVAYLMGITDVDPIRFNLLFERFINPERLDLPDADLDFMSSRRHEVIEYLQDKYGKDRVAGISNYATLASASAFRDTGRVFGLAAWEMSATKLVPKLHGISATLTEAAEQVPEIEKLKEDQPEVWKHALVLEGNMRALGQHAAGVIVSRDPLVNRAVVETRGELPVVSWDKRIVEDFGLVKLDLLGLSTLDVLSIAKQYIKERHSVDIDYLSIPLEEPDVMEQFGKGNTTGVFQFESGGMRDLLKKLAVGGPLTFEDITAATALYRPGPMDSGLLDDFVNIKQGRSVPHYDHPLMEPALKDTYSVIVYQEQVMQVAVDLAGFTRAEADHLRKAMGKKDKEKMAEQRSKWVEGCKKTAGMADRDAERLFDKIEAFAGYGFNRSHAVEYSVISYWTMWLRTRYPAEYFAACMSIVKEDKLPGLVKDAREFGIEVFPPDVNVSTDRYVIVSDKKIVAPFNAVLGCSDTIAKKIVELREAQPGQHFATAEDFIKAAGEKGTKVNARVVERLDKVGALPGRAIGPRHPDRRKDQIELMPGLIIDTIKADRTTDMTEPFLRSKVIALVKEYNGCEDCSLKDSPHPSIRIPKNLRFMVITDCPTWEEEKEGKLMTGDSADWVKLAIHDAGLNVGDGYYTTLVKARKPTGEKFLSNEQLNGCRKYIEQEIAVLKPAVIVALGSATAKYLAPDAKNIAELTGKAVYDSKLDATIVFGINPAQVNFDPSKQDILQDVFKSVAEIVN